eukprot:GFUD01038736.1.p1 GENE.GFUD01038736.1~~GFUD01038736.1.p1  ORF type:complete len:285 (+),score=54.08 GFUD01038736.1:170-1024(+)
MSPCTTSAEDKLLSDRLARLPVRVTRSRPHNHHQVTRTTPHQNQLQVYRKPATNINKVNHLKYSQPNLQKRKRVTKSNIADTAATDHIQELVLKFHMNLRKSRTRRPVDWSFLNMARGIVRNSGGGVNLDLECRQSYTPSSQESPPCLYSSPPSIDSGYDTAEFSPSCTTLASHGESLGHVKEIDQFLDSFEFRPHEELQNMADNCYTSDTYESGWFDGRSFEEVQTLKHEVEESIENIGEYVKKLTSGDYETEKKPASNSQIPLHDLNRQSFTVLQVDPINSN